jgi:hypothetical protein
METGQKTFRQQIALAGRGGGRPVLKISLGYLLESLKRLRNHVEQVFYGKAARTVAKKATGVSVHEILRGLQPTLNLRTG